MSREEILREAAAAVYGFPTSIRTLLEETREFFRRFVVVSELQADTIALWVAHTYVFDVAKATPYLHFWSPDPGSGKTTALEALEVTCRDGMTVDDLTGASLFRFIEARRPTLLIDEVDGIFGKKQNDGSEDIRKVLNSGYRAGKRVIRMGGPRHDEVHMFDPYCPKALAGLRELPGTLAHRSIPVAMQPPLPEEHYQDFDPEEVEEEAQQLRDRLKTWAESAQDALRDPAHKPTKLPELDARRNQIWSILLRVADLAGGNWPDRAREAAVKLSSGDRRADEASVGIRLLGHIRDVFSDDKMSIKEIAEALNAIEDATYGGWNDGDGIRTRELGWKLKPYGIIAKPIRVDGERRGNGYEKAQFKDAWSRYLPDTAPTTGTTGTSGSRSQKQAEKEPAQDKAVPVVEEPANPHEQRAVPVVPVLDAGYGDDRLFDDVERARHFDEQFPRLADLPRDAQRPRTREEREELRREVDRRRREQVGAEDAARREETRALFATDKGDA
jgi:hypothetical protein